MAYQYTRHVFGAKDSPTCRNYDIQQRTQDNGRQYPETSQAVLEKFCKNDFLDSLYEPDKTLNRAKELVELNKLGGLKLIKFVK